MDFSPSGSKSDTLKDTPSSSSEKTRDAGALMTLGDYHAQPVDGTPRPDILSLTPRPIDLLYALRRRWKWALGLGVLCAAVAVAAAWLLIPVNYTATAWLRIATSRPRIIFKTNEDNDLLSHRNAQATLMTSKFVLNAALRKPGVSQLPDIRNERDQVSWMQQHIRVSFPGGSEILQIAMTGEDPGQLVKMVNAVKDAYMEEVVAVERESHLRRKRVLEQSYQRNLEQIKKKNYVYRELADQILASDSEAAKVREIHELETLANLRDRVNQLRGEIGGKKQRITLMQARLDHFRKKGGEEGEEAGEEEKAEDKEKQGEIDKETMIDRLVENTLHQDPWLAQAKSQVTAIEAAVFEERLRAARPDLPSLVRMEEKLKALVEEILRREAEMRPIIRESIGEQLAAGIDLTSGTPQAPTRETIEDIEIDLSVHEKELEVALEAFTAAASEAEKNGAYSAELESKKSELERLKTMTGKMGVELQQWEIELAAAPRVTLLEAASVPRTSDIEKKYKKVSFIGLTAFALAVFGVTAIDFLSRRVNSPSEVAYGLGVRVMGDVPLISGRSGRHRRTLSGSASTPREGMLAESIDNIRTALLHRAASESIRSVMVTSSLEKEGKTTVASQLSASLARSGRRTLLIDGDLRRPTAHRLFELPVGPGLSELLRGEAELEEVLRPTRVAGLWMIPSGKCDAEAVQALAKNAIADEFKQLRAEYDFIVIDSGPVLTDADALLFAQYSDAVILSVLRDVSRVPRVFEACERLRAVDAKLLGAVVNGMSMGRYYRSYYRPYTIRVESST